LNGSPKLIQAVTGGNHDADLHDCIDTMWLAGARTEHEWAGKGDTQYALLH